MGASLLRFLLVLVLSGGDNILCTVWLGDIRGVTSRGLLVRGGDIYYS
jgi:hypothetical protein